MGIVNVTPDSFSDGGKFINPDKAIAHGLRLISEGADILDVGGESTRPGAKAVDIAEEIARVVPVVEGLRKAGARWVSVDTRNAATMEAAIRAGANAVNDISALSHDVNSAAVVAAAKIPVFLMHMQGTPETMQINPSYKNVVEEVVQYLQSRISYCDTQRIDEKMIVVDPGIGFGKSVEHNLSILRNISEFHRLSVPVMLGLSRKSFIAKVTGDESLEGRISGSVSGALYGLSQGVQIYRVHDVRETKAAFNLWQKFFKRGDAEARSSLF